MLPREWQTFSRHRDCKPSGGRDWGITEQNGMIETKRKEEISKSYLNAVCAIKGIAVDYKCHDDDGLDAFLHKVVQLADGTKYIATISAQLKSTSSNYTESKSLYKYPLKAKNYDDLRRRGSITSYLFLLILPESENDWVTHDIDSLVIKRCMFWLKLEGLPTKKNKSTVTVHIPKTNVVSPEKLDEILTATADGELP